MGIVLSSQFDVQTGLALDSRLVVDDLTARDVIAALVRYRGMLVYVLSDNTFYYLSAGITNSDWKKLKSGGGGGSLEWFESGPAPIEDFEYFKRVHKYQNGLTQNLFVNIPVPADYAAGEPIFLRVKFFSPDVSGTALLSASTMITLPELAVSDLSTNIWASIAGATNLATVGLANALHEVLLDLTDPTGESAAGNPVEPGSLLTVALARGVDTATSDIRFIRGSAEVLYGT